MYNSRKFTGKYNDMNHGNPNTPKDYAWGCAVTALIPFGMIVLYMITQIIK